MASDGTRRFAVHASGAIIAAFRRLHRRAERRGRGAEVTAAFRQIVERLGTEPFQTGEPAYRLSGLRMQVRKVVVRPPVVDFAVCEDRPLVFLKGVRLLTMLDL